MPAPVSEILNAASVIPVLTVHDVSTAAPLAEALAAGGLRVIEITLRTEQGLDAMQAMKAAVPELYVGMGTIRRPGQVAASVEAGADFLVSPGLTPSLVRPMLESGVACLPGVGTISEAMTAIEAGFEALKFFPAEQAGGAPFLKSLYGPLPDIRFCPTGSISRELAPAYLKLPNVACVGGSWLATKAQIEAGDWDAISENARAAEAMKAEAS
jgi:2-dehydro-3-deoxyphosphogluconate aldolase/(4S)-4-hydroxy-2-oxoglutarate aldolase